MPAKQSKPRLPALAESDWTAEQRTLRDAIFANRPGMTKFSGPFAIWLHAPAFGDLAQRVGAYCRFKTSLAPTLSEFAILTIARHWRAQYEWKAHAAIGERVGISRNIIAELRAGRYPKAASADQRAIYDLVTELHRKKRVSDRNYARVLKIVGAEGMVELIGILGYYTLISMTLNVFRAPLDSNEPPPFPEPHV